MKYYYNLDLYNVVFLLPHKMMAMERDFRPLPIMFFSAFLSVIMIPETSSTESTEGPCAVCECPPADRGKFKQQTANGVNRVHVMH